jgi:hypothetical protein
MPRERGQRELSGNAALGAVLGCRKIPSCVRVVFISGASHVVLVALALLGTPKLFDNPQLEVIEVDLVRPQEAEPPKDKPEEKPPRSGRTRSPRQFDPFSPQNVELPPQAASKSPRRRKRGQRSSANPLRPSTPSGPPVPAPAPAAPQPSTPWIFDPANHSGAAQSADRAGTRIRLRNRPTAANLSADDKAAFKAHLKTCWKLPDGMTPAQTTRVVVRVFSESRRPPAADPLLIEASASRDGPALLQAAIRTLKDCQPYVFLPADRYRDWKVLDLSFSPVTWPAAEPQLSRGSHLIVYATTCALHNSLVALRIIRP